MNTTNYGNVLTRANLKMLNLVNTSPTTAISRKYINMGIMNTWASNYSPHILTNSGLLWALDNNCFNVYNPEKITQALIKYQHVPNNLFAVVPDVVQDAIGTNQLWGEWVETFRRYGYKTAYVAQNGLEHLSVQWGEFDCLFIGGDTAFKLSDFVAELVQEARAKNKWVHNGRVNTITRVKYSNSIGCHSTDGTGYSRFAQYITKHNPYFEVKQHRLGGF